MIVRKRTRVREKEANVLEITSVKRTRARKKR